jgi:hypothetical protein
LPSISQQHLKKIYLEDHLITISGFRLRDTVSRIIPGALFIIYLIFEYSEQIMSITRIGNTELIFLVAILSYPLGITSELIALNIIQLIFKLTKNLSDSALIKKYLNCTQTEFWNRYIKIYSSGKSELIAVLDQYNLLRFFFLNMTFFSLLAVIIHSFHSKVIIDWFNCILIFFIVVFYLYYMTTNNGFYMLWGIADKTLTDKKR